jgi:hypothetical protein
MSVRHYQSNIDGVFYQAAFRELINDNECLPDIIPKQFKTISKTKCIEIVI